MGWYTPGDVGNGGMAPPGVPQGELGTKSRFSEPLIDKTQWVAGSVVEVAWGITANHGGGYQFRICPASGELTEQCFQQQVLPFVGESQWLQYGNGGDPNNRTEIPATQVVVTEWCQLGLHGDAIPFLLATLRLRAEHCTRSTDCALVQLSSPQPRMRGVSDRVHVEAACQPPAATAKSSSVKISISALWTK